MILQHIDYEVDGVCLRGFLADGSTRRPAPGVLIAHESLGLTDHIRDRAISLAEEGFVVFALDLFGLANLTLDEARRQSALIMLTPKLMFARSNAALQVLANSPHVDANRLAALGYCLGGVAVLEMARHGAPIRCAIAIHPGFRRPSESPNRQITAKILVLTGDLDPVVSVEERGEFVRSMNAARADWELHTFGGVGHSYTNPEVDAFGLAGFKYDGPASRRSWDMAVALLREQLEWAQRG